MRRSVAAVVLGVLALPGCGSDEPAATFEATAAWSRPSPPGAVDGVLYLTVGSDVDDEIVAVEVPADVATSAELHATTTADGAPSHHGDGDETETTGATDTTSASVLAGDVLVMSQLETVPIEGGTTVEFEPGGNHVMLVGLARPLERDEHYTATLRFASGRSLAVDVVVADNPPE